MRAAINFLILVSAIMLQVNKLYAQFSVTMPLNRSVFQRVNNHANIQIGGSTQYFLHEIQVKLEVRNGGIARDWTTVNTNVQPGEFRGQLLNIEPGWYEMHIRGLVDGYQIVSAEVERVGVGEVFIIAGQSNAQGGRNNPDYATQIYYGAQDDRVNGINWSTDDINETYPLPNIVKIPAETDIAPTGKASWCWALLGDQIAQNWNVPVMFFNAAIGATTVNTWSQSANNNTFPYIYLKKTFEYYAKIYGVRALLWHQGESDIFNFDTNMPQSCMDYSTNLSNLINISRNDYNQNLSWVISKVSMLAGYTSPSLVNCQEVQANIPNTNRFLGPYTDPIQPNAWDRDGAVHFRGTGFILLAEAWFDALNTPNFINNSQPIAATNNLKIANNQFQFGNSLAPCWGVNQTIGSGNWNDPAVWSCGVAPNSLNDIKINEGHTITIENSTFYYKTLTVNGTINLGSNGVLLQSQY